MDFFNPNENCEFKECYLDLENRIVTFCDLRGQVIPSSICKICEKRKQYKKECGGDEIYY